MPQTPNLHSTHPFQPVSPSIIEPSIELQVARPTCIQFPEPSCSEDPLTEVKLLGPFRRILRVTGLDCTVMAQAQNDPSLAIKAIFCRILAFFMIFLTVFRCATIFNASGAVMSIQWAESNMFAFMALQTIICAVCLYKWTKNGFVAAFLEGLEPLRQLRIVKNSELDDYSGRHKIALLWASLWFLFIMAHSTACGIARKVILSGSEVSTFLAIFIPITSSISCVIVAVCVTIYYLVNCSLAREIQYFNKELEEAVKEKRMVGSLELMFSNRQAELLKFVRKINESLEMYASGAPIVCFYAFINASYITGAQDILPTAFFIILLFNLFAIIAMTVFSLRPASNVQLQIIDTSRILMECEEFAKTKDSDVFQNYHLMIDRSLKTDTRMRVAGGIPIYETSMNVSMLLIPNLGNVLTLIRKTMLAHGMQV